MQKEHQMAGGWNTDAFNRAQAKNDAAPPGEEGNNKKWLPDAAAAADCCGGRRRRPEPLLLYRPQDREHLSDLMCLVRKQVEVFVPRPPRLAPGAQDDSRPDSPYVNGRVGLRCVHCAKARKGKEDDDQEMINQPYYPKSISLIYESVMNWQRHHMLSCPCMPDAVMDEYSRMRAAPWKRRSEDDSAKYWESSCERIGLVDTAEGIKMMPGALEDTVGSSSAEASMQTLATQGDAAKNGPSLPYHRVQTVIFVRHGVAEHNFPGADLSSPLLYDPPLLHQGKVGALEVGQRIRKWFHLQPYSPRVELVICSPLTRCLQTAALAFLPGDEYWNSRPAPAPCEIERTECAPIACVEQVREAHGMYYPDKRRPKSMLKRHWPQIQFDTNMTEDDEQWLETQRESMSGLARRIDSFLQALCRRPENFVAVVTHGVWMETLFRKYNPAALEGGKRRVHNCDAFSTECVSSIPTPPLGREKYDDAVFVRLEKTHLV